MSPASPTSSTRASVNTVQVDDEEKESPVMLGLSITALVAAIVFLVIQIMIDGLDDREKPGFTASDDVQQEG